MSTIALGILSKKQGRHQQIPRTIPYNQLIENAGGLRRWENSDVMPRPGDALQERLYCIRWRTPGRINERGRESRGDLIYREPRAHDQDSEQRILDELRQVFDDWQAAGWIPNWRIEPGQETTRLTREKGWTYWHHLYTPRQLVMAGQYSRRMAACALNVRAALLLALSRLLDMDSRLCYWLTSQGGGIGGTKTVFYNLALNTFPNYVARAFPA